MTALWEIYIGAGVAVSVLIGLLVNIKNIVKFFKEFKEFRKERFAEKNAPYFYKICPTTDALIAIILRLDNLLEFVGITRDISIETHGMRLIDKCSAVVKKEFATQDEKDDLIHGLIPYVIGDGNGKVISHVQYAMNLPTYLGGPVDNVDLGEIIQREIERYEKRKKDAK